MKKIFLLLVLIMSTTLVFADSLNVKGDIKERIETEVGKDFTIVLPSNRTTGYGWELTKPVNAKKITSQGVKYLRDSDAVVGSGGKELWSFRANAAGKTKIYLRYVRPWAKNALMSRKAVILVTIRQDSSLQKQ